MGLEEGQQGVSIERMLEKMPEPADEILDDLGRMQSEGFLEMYSGNSKIPQYSLSEDAEKWVNEKLDFSEDYQKSVRSVIG